MGNSHKLLGDWKTASVISTAGGDIHQLVVISDIWDR